MTETTDNKENEMTDLFTALAAAQGEMKNAGFDSQNKHFGNTYASLSAVRDAVVPALSAQGIAVTQTTVLDPFHLVTTLHKGGESISSQWPLSLAKPQEMGSQLTYARRYCLLAICGINGDVDDDAEEAKTAPKPGSTVRAAATPPQRPAEASGNAETDKPAWTGPINRSALQGRARASVDELGQCTDSAMLAGYWQDKDLQAALKQMQVDLPEFYTAVLEAKDLAKERCAEEDERRAIQGQG